MEPIPNANGQSMPKKERQKAPRTPSDGGSVISPLDASKLISTYTDSPRTVPDEATANASNESTCTDHMVCVTWRENFGWSTPELKPYGPLSLMPTASCLHYATECFEGMKVYRGYDGALRVFRPDRNTARLGISANRISLPSPEPKEVKKLILALISVDGPKWLPTELAGSFLYVRPTIIGTQPQLGVKAPNEAMLYIIMSFMPRLDTVAGGMRLMTSPDDMVRAWTGGFGYAKIGPNYGPSVSALKGAWDLGYNQVLWLYGESGECTEAGGSNLFFVWTREDGRKELITAPLDGKLILDGVTRRSCIELATERLGHDLVVSERRYTITEVMEAASEGRLVESFSTGTAYFICAVSQIHHRGKDIRIPAGPKGDAGEVTSLMKRWLEDIMYGRIKHRWGTVVSER